MADPTPPVPTGSESPPGPTINIGDEFGTAKRNLPPAKIVLIALAVVAVVGGIVAFTQRAKPQGQGTLDYLSVAEIPGRSTVMVAATVTLENSGTKPLYIHAISGTVTGPDGKVLQDDAASAIDFERYFQALPALREHAIDPLIPETKLMPGSQKKGTVVFSFKVDRNAFDAKSFKVVIQPYDQPAPIVLGQ